MKNIIIGGTVRSGKTTLANVLRVGHNYCVCESDTIVNAFHHVFPELGIVHNKPQSTKENYKPFLFELLNGFLKGLKYNGYVTVFPGSQFLPCHINEYENKDKYIVIFLGIDSISPDELFQKIRTFDTANDWTHKQTDEFLHRECEKIVAQSKELKTECEKYGFYYFDTANDRTATFEQISKLIKSLQD